MTTELERYARRNSSSIDTISRAYRIELTLISLRVCSCYFGYMCSQLERPQLLLGAAAQLEQQPAERQLPDRQRPCHFCKYRTPSRIIREADRLTLGPVTISDFVQNGTAQIFIDRIPSGTYSLLFVNSSNYELDRKC